MLEQLRPAQANLRFLCILTHSRRCSWSRAFAYGVYKVVRDAIDFRCLEHYRRPTDGSFGNVAKVLLKAHASFFAGNSETGIVTRDVLTQRTMPLHRSAGVDSFNLPGFVFFLRIYFHHFCVRRGTPAFLIGRLSCRRLCGCSFCMRDGLSFSVTN